MQKTKAKIAAEKGQVMLLTVLLISGGILSIASITAYLMAQRLHLASNIGDSTKAIYAADTGMEWSLYRSIKPEEAQNNPWSSSSTQSLSNGAKFTANNKTLYVKGSVSQSGWLTPRCSCDVDQGASECGNSFISSVSYPDDLCYDNTCSFPGFCAFGKISYPYTASSTTDTVSIGKSGSTVRAFELSM